MRTILLLACLFIVTAGRAQDKPVTENPVLSKSCPGSIPQLRAIPTYQTVDICALTPGNYNVPDQGKVFTAAAIKVLPYTNINDIVSLAAGAYQQRRGAPICMDGGRSTGNLYVVNRMRILEY